MASTPVKRLFGMRDLREEEYLQLRHAQETLQSLLSTHGYRIIETPLLEPMDTFARQAGGELASHLYTFQEPGGHNVALRPEFTSAVMRVFRENEGRVHLPVRWQYAGEVFRYQPEDTGLPRQFWQVGAELIGASGPQADAEAVALSVKGLQALGFQGVQVLMGDMGVLRSFLNHFGLTERSQQFLLRNLPALKTGETDVKTIESRAASVGLLRKENAQDIKRLLSTVEDEEHENGNGHNASPRRWVSSRSPEEVAEGLRRKLATATQPQQFDGALECLRHLSQMSGDPASILEEARKLAIRYQVDVSSIYAFQETLQAVRSHNLGARAVQIDLSLAHNIAYYTGMVFELRVPLVSSVPLGSGGRYDGLLKTSKEARDIAAIGFAFSIDQVAQALTTLNTHQTRRGGKRTLVVPQTPDAYAASLGIASTLRLAGESVEQALVERSLEEHMDYARAKVINAVVVVGKGGESERHFIESP
ncbi:MAG: histidine--tRNA ligase family protein [Dehalococcoidia bacterium]|nr:histidine--tRNA ligase family protein [Dehalococcoidia bacterium]